MTRKDYMDGIVSHDDYYSVLADALGTKELERLVLSMTQVPKIRAALDSGDEHLNTIPLLKWDRLHSSVFDMVKKMPSVMAISWDGVKLKPGTVCWSLSESVSVLKAVAKRMAGRHAKI